MTSSTEILDLLAEIHETLDELVGDIDDPKARALHEAIDSVIDAIVVDDDDHDADALGRVAEVLDSLLALDIIVPVIGPLLERFDGILIAGALRWLGGILRPDPERQAMRQAKRAQARRRRQERRRERRGE